MAITRLSELGGDILRVDAFLDQAAVGGDLIYRMHSQAREVFGSGILGRFLFDDWRARPIRPPTTPQGLP
ncbi:MULTISPECIES: hypothetical protein [unclassified Mesorhizobium]|uniref:hypothetical protein n=1 Tax=unclassified Mesorhizobium TaxID=325217 RepID=UPI000FD3DFCA|nr:MULTISPECIES: hypothetical protein [unclassified Mesorhizobium]RUU48850.1 hypothetical protein EOD08_00815 [Mesorhizobium sp. M6A.T.Ca.TU.002.02.2.1]RVB72207.1 hypothetical protein EN885_29965 [Mesorhizobium sp. M6A.T.Cr.TU.014.01.1.1]RWD32143.1 MAG: hypothetical protein EOS34_21685 [Mesorhizobium sp.]RWN58343.1 MAG: hypothetical protein EOR99_34030 [Mesorhizobium sp.]RWP96148.1 MAG: hypothetical protein EOR90_30565 [Mesorhizobium sp.]